MKCPRSGGSLKTIIIGGISLDVSEGCGGVFFDNYELEKFDEMNELSGAMLVKHLAQFEKRDIPEEGRVNCPKCEKIVMMRRFYSPQKLLEIDECPGCAGIWLDTGELKFLREVFVSDEKRTALFDELLRKEGLKVDVDDNSKEMPDNNNFKKFEKFMDQIFLE